jgi:hypothetical protein
LGGLGVPPTGVPLSRLIDIRHELTALINSELYGGGGNKIEGRAALMARRGLHEFFFHTAMPEQDTLADHETLKSAIILMPLAEQLTLLEQAP